MEKYLFKLGHLSNCLCAPASLQTEQLPVQHSYYFYYYNYSSIPQWINMLYYKTPSWFI